MVSEHCRGVFIIRGELQTLLNLGTDVERCFYRLFFLCGRQPRPDAVPATSLLDTEQIFQLLISAPLNSDEFEAALNRLFADDSATTAALTPKTPSPAGCTSGGLGAQARDTTASARVAECLCVPSPTPPDDTSTKVPPSLLRFQDCSLARQVILQCLFMSLICH